MVNYNVDPRLGQLIDFICLYQDWKERIQKAPYFVKVREKGNYVLLKYDMYNSDLSNPIVQACRGIIIDQTTKEKEKMVVCCSFMKFFNQGEKKMLGADEEGNLQFGEDLSYPIDYNKPYEIQEKLDGSMLRLWYHNNSWHVSTSGMIDAADATVSGSTQSYADLFWKAFDACYNSRDALGQLDKNLTYTFELVSPESRLVVEYKQTMLYLLMAFNNKTWNELNIKEIPELRTTKFRQPSVYQPEFLSQMDEIDNFEGCVISQVDDNGVLQRVKLKTEKYLTLFKMRENTGSDKNILKAIIEGKVDDVLTAFPEYAQKFSEVKAWLDESISTMNKILDSCDYSLDKKTFALMYRELPMLAHCFRRYGNKSYSAEDFYLNPDNFNKVWDMYRNEVI